MLHVSAAQTFKELDVQEESGRGEGEGGGETLEAKILNMYKQT